MLVFDKRCKLIRCLVQSKLMRKCGQEVLGGYSSFNLWYIICSPVLKRPAPLIVPLPDVHAPFRCSIQCLLVLCSDCANGHALGGCQSAVQCSDKILKRDLVFGNKLCLGSQEERILDSYVNPIPHVYITSRVLRPFSL